VITTSESRWWDDVKTNGHSETREEIVTRAFRNAISVLEQRFGGNVDRWTWGRLHTLEFQHVLGRQKPLDLLFNAGPYPVGGNYSQVDAMAYARGEETFEVLAGPSTRRIVDFANLGKTWGISPLGNSGNFLSPHATDQAKLFIRGEYRAQLMDEKEVEHDAESSLVLRPR
jgi:penicillin amidase